MDPRRDYLAEDSDLAIGMECAWPADFAVRTLPRPRPQPAAPASTPASARLALLLGAAFVLLAASGGTQAR